MSIIWVFIEFIIGSINRKVITVLIRKKNITIDSVSHTCLYTYLLAGLASSCICILMLVSCI